jgi:phage-related baseplate assembly protein
MADELNIITTNSQVIYENTVGNLEIELNEPLYPGDERRLFAEAQSAFMTSYQNTANAQFKQRFMQYAEGEVLDAHGESEGCARLIKQKAKTIQRFSLFAPQNMNVVIPVGTKVTADSNKYFETIEVAVIEAGKMYVDTVVEALEGGSDYNGYAVGLINLLVDQIPYVAAVGNLEVTAGGDNGEPYPDEDGGAGDESYRDRIRLVQSSKTTAGAESTYEFYAKSADASIADVKITSPSPCNISILVLCKDGKLPDDEILAKVEKAVTAKEVRPLGDRVTVTGVEPVSYDIEFVYYTTVEEESAVVEAIEGENGAIQKYVSWQSERIGRAINPDRLRADILKSESQPTGAERVEIVAPLYATLSSTQIAQWSGKATVRHEIIVETEE